MNVSSDHKVAGVCLTCADKIYEQESTGWLHEAVELQMSGAYGSDHDLTQYRAFMCDGCVNYLIRKNRVKAKREHPYVPITDPTWVPMDNYGKKVVSK